MKASQYTNKLKYAFKMRYGTSTETILWAATQ